MTRRLTILLTGAVAVLAAAPSASAQLTLINARPVDAVEGDEIRDHVVAEFSDDGACQPALYDATVHWGDGDSPGVVGQREKVNGSCVYFVRGTHTYVRAGTYPLSVTVTGTGETATSAAASATIREAEVRGQALPLVAQSGVQLAQEVAELHDRNRFSAPSDFTATIDWGDGSSSPGTVTGTGGRFGIEGAHTYATPGEYRLMVTVVHAGQTIVLDPATVTVVQGPAPTPGPGPTGPVVGGAAAEFGLRVLGSPLTVSSVRRRGILLRVQRGDSRATRARLELRRGTRVLQRARLRLGRSGETLRIRFRPSRGVARGLRPGRYTVRLRMEGVPALQARFRLRR